MAFKFIVNPTAGRGRTGKLVDDLHRVLKDRGIEYDLVLTRQAGHGQELAEKASSEGWPVVVAVGGDGTMNEVLNGIMVGNRATALGVMPTGTGNDLARTLGIPLDFAGAVDRLLAGQSRTIDVGRDNDGFFSIVCGLGFAADVMHHVNTHHAPWLRGPLAIAAGVISVVNTLHPTRFRVEIDGKSWDSDLVAVFVLNTRFTGGGMMVSPQAAPDDGLLDVVLIRKISRLALLGLLPKVYSGKHLGHPCVEIYHARRVSFTPDPDVRMIKMFDGNIQGMAPLTAELLPSVLTVRA